MARHNGAVLSCTQIFEAVWGCSADVDSERLINAHIRRQREKAIRLPLSAAK
jgi:DNA-binding response OmpR family regulator